jgi:CBS domain-containing protein
MPYLIGDAYMRVKDIMTRNVIYVDPDTKVLEAAKKLKSANIHTVLVMQDKKLAGIVVDRDLVLRVLAEGRDPSKIRVMEIMTRDPITIAPETNVIDAGKLMKNHKVSRLPVIDKDGMVAGIVSEIDFPTIIGKLE